MKRLNALDRPARCRARLDATTPPLPCERRDRIFFPWSFRADARVSVAAARQGER